MAKAKVAIRSMEETVHGLLFGNRRQYMANRLREVGVPVEPNLAGMAMGIFLIKRASGAPLKPGLGKRLKERYPDQVAKCREGMYWSKETAKEVSRLLCDSSSVEEIGKDLAALGKEFAGVRLENGCLEVVTHPIVLSCPEESVPDTEMGAYRIKLNLAGKTYSVANAVPIAHFPRDYPHPHVAGGRMCEGDGGAAIQKSIREGRLFDFFTLVNSVLTTYNPRSPHRRLHLFNLATAPVRCGRCARETSRTGLGTCSCGAVVCRECSRVCLECGAVVCADCAHVDSVTQAWICRSHGVGCRCGNRVHKKWVKKCRVCGGTWCPICETARDRFRTEDRCPRCRG